MDDNTATDDAPTSPIPLPEFSPDVALDGMLWEDSGGGPPETRQDTSPDAHHDFHTPMEATAQQPIAEENSPTNVIKCRKRVKRTPDPHRSRWEEITWLIASLQHTITKQSDEIKQVQANQLTIARQNEILRLQIETTKEQNDTIRNQNDALQAEVTALRSEIQARKATSWATIAARPSTLTPASSPVPATAPTHQSTPPNLPGINIDFAGIVNPRFDTSDPKAIRERVRQAFDSHPDTKSIGWIGIAKQGTDSARVRICLRTEDDAIKAKRHDDWLHSHFYGARMQGEQWYPIKVDRVNKESICDEALVRIRSDACATIGSENGITVNKVRMLGRPNPDKRYCSIVMHLARKQDADGLLQRSYMEIGGEVAYTKAFEPATGPKRCFNCQRFNGHEARKCPAKEPTCGACASSGHTERDCASETPKCANCSGPHKASDRRCPEYRRLRQGTNQPIYHA